MSAGFSQKHLETLCFGGCPLFVLHAAAVLIPILCLRRTVQDICEAVFHRPHSSLLLPNTFNPNVRLFEDVTVSFFSSFRSFCCVSPRSFPFLAPSYFQLEMLSCFTSFSTSQLKSFQIQFKVFEYSVFEISFEWKSIGKAVERAQPLI